MSTSRSLIIVLCFIILLIFPIATYGQPTEEKDDYYCFDLSDTQEVARCLQDRNLLRQLVELQKKTITNLEKENELLKKELELKDKIIEIVEREVASTRRALNDMKEVTDRALKLSEIGKKSPIMDVIDWIIRILCFAAGVFIAK